MTCYMSKYQGNFAFSVHDPFNMWILDRSFQRVIMWWVLSLSWCSCSDWSGSEFDTEVRRSFTSAWNTLLCFSRHFTPLDHLRSSNCFDKHFWASVRAWRDLECVSVFDLSFIMPTLIWPPHALFIPYTHTHAHAHAHTHTHRHTHRCANINWRTRAKTGQYMIL